MLASRALRRTTIIADSIESSLGVNGACRGREVPLMMRRLVSPSWKYCSHFFAEPFIIVAPTVVLLEVNPGGFPEQAYQEALEVGAVMPCIPPYGHHGLFDTVILWQKRYGLF